MLLTKTFGQQANVGDEFRALNAKLAELQIRQAMVGRWFFMIVGTIFSITPGVRVLARRLAGHPGRPDRADDRRHRRVHDAPEPAVLPARPAAQRAGRDPGRAGAVRPDLRVPRAGPGDRRRAGCGRARPAQPCAARSGSATCPSATRPRPCRPSGRATASARQDGRRPEEQVERRGRCRVGRRRGGRDAGRRERATRGEIPAIEMLPTFALEDIDFEARAGPARRARRPVGLGQDDDDLPDPAAVRRRRRRGRDRRHRRAPDHARVARPR